MTSTVMSMLLPPGSHADELPVLNLVMSVVVVLNIILIGVSTDLSRDWIGWDVIDIIFASTYTIEAMVKMKKFGFSNYWIGTDARWNHFDFALLTLAWFEVVTEILRETASSGTSGRTSLLRLFRLVRITKVLRICRLGVFADLVMILNGAIGSAKTLIYSVILINIPLYVVSLILNGLLEGEEYADSKDDDNAFSSLGYTFFNMFRCIVAGECTATDGKPIFARITRSHEHGWVFGVIYCVTVMFMTFGLFNVIVAIYVENIVSAAKVVGTRSKRKRLMDKKYFQDKIMELLWLIQEVRSIDAGSSHDKKNGRRPHSPLVDFGITPDFLDHLLAHEEFVRILQELDIADEDMVDLFETLDVDGNGVVDMEELIIGIFKLRGEGRRADIIAVSLLCRSVQENIVRLHAAMENMQCSQNTCIQYLQTHTGVASLQDLSLTRSRKLPRDFSARLGEQQHVATMGAQTAEDLDEDNWDSVSI